jgi:hypothetical protein
MGGLMHEAVHMEPEAVAMRCAVAQALAAECRIVAA